jgi:HEAT repeat protein
VVLPVIEVRAADRRLEKYYHSLSAAISEEEVWARFRAEVNRLGGPGSAARKISIYLRMPETLAVGGHGVYLGRDYALMALGECGEAGVGTLLRIIREESKKTRSNASNIDYVSYYAVDPRQGAVPALGRTGSRRGVSILVGLLGDPHIADAAAKALGRIGDPSCVDAVIAELKQGHEQAGLALKLLKDPRGAGPVLPLLGDPDATMRERAADVLSVHGPEAVGPLLARLSDEAQRVRIQAARSLGRIGDPRAVEPLLAMLRRKADDEMLLKESKLLGRPLMRTPDGGAVDPGAPMCAAQERVAAAEALGRIGDRRAVGPLTAALKDPYGEVRRDATVALWAIRTPRDAGALRAALRELVKDVRAGQVRLETVSGSGFWDALLKDDREEVRAAEFELHHAYAMPEESN